MKVSDSILKDINEDIISIWKKYPGITERIPLLYTELKTNGLLFIGNNPSFIINGISARIRSSEEFKKYWDHPVSLFNYDNFNECLQDYYLYLSKGRNSVMNGDSQYFKIFCKISDIIGIEWEHIDLYYISNTSQKEVEKLIALNQDFFDEQAQVTVKLIRHLNPKIIVIGNASSGYVLWKLLKLKFDRTIGTYLYKYNEKEIPVFISSMLTGQRALDVESRIRLIWHIDYVCKLLNIKRDIKESNWDKLQPRENWIMQ